MQWFEQLKKAYQLKMNTSAFVANFEGILSQGKPESTYIITKV